MVKLMTVFYTKKDSTFLVGAIINNEMIGDTNIIVDLVDVETLKDSKLTFSLSQNYPNPFNSCTTISYSITKRGLVQLKVYDILGREVSTLINKKTRTRQLRSKI